MYPPKKAIPLYICNLYATSERSERAPQKHNYRPLFSHMVWHYKLTVSDKTLTLRKYKLSDTSACSHFHILVTTAISFNILLVLLILSISETHLSGLKVHLHVHTINTVGYYLMVGVVYKRQYTDKTLTLRKSMYMRAKASGA